MDPYRDKGSEQEVFFQGLPDTRALSLAEQIQQTRQHLQQLEEQRSLSEQIQKTEQHLTHLLSLASSSALQQQQALPGAASLPPQPRQQNSSGSSWSASDPNFFSFLRQPPLRPGADALDGSRLQPHMNTHLHLGGTSAPQLRTNPEPMGLSQPGVYSPHMSLGLQGQLPFEVPHSQHSPASSNNLQRIPPRQPGEAGASYLRGAVMGQHHVGAQEVGFPAEAGGGRPALALEHSPSGIHARLSQPPLRPPIPPTPQSPLAIAPMPSQLPASLWFGAQDPAEAARLRSVPSFLEAEPDVGQGHGKARRRVEPAAEAGVGGQLDSLMCRHGVVWAHCPECGGAAGRGWQAAGAHAGEGEGAGKRAAAEAGQEGRGATKCEHGRQRSRCKECGGSGVCAHNRQRGTCKECRGSQICPHSRRRSLCKDCGGSQICAHGRQRSYCKDCKGSGICEHNRRRSSCKECGGSGICVHGRLRRQCKDCGGSSICPHGRQRSLCKDCGGSQICEHGKRKKQCRQCNPPLPPSGESIPEEPSSSTASGSGAGGRN